MNLRKTIIGALGALALAFGMVGAAGASVVSPNSTGFTNMSPDDVLNSPGEEILFAVTGADTGAISAEFDFTNLTGFNTGQVVKVSVNANPTVSIRNLQFLLNGSSLLQVTSDSDPATILATDFFVALANGLNTLKVTGTGLLTGASGFNASILATPIPAAGLLFGSALLIGGLYRRRKMVKEFGLPS